MPKTMPTGIIRSPMYTGNPRIIGQTRGCGYQACDSRLQFQLFAIANKSLLLLLTVPSYYWRLIMEDYKFMTWVQEQLDNYSCETTDSDFTLNLRQVLSFATITYRLQTLANEVNGTVQPVQIYQRLGCASVSASLPTISLHDIDVGRYCSSLTNADRVTIEALSNGNVGITVTVSGIFE